MDPPHLCADRLHRGLHLLALGGWDIEADSGSSLSRRMRGSDDLAWAGRHVACRWGRTRLEYSSKAGHLNRTGHLIDRGWVTARVWPLPPLPRSRVWRWNWRLFDVEGGESQKGTWMG